jgi:hypothetical protein
MLSDLDSECPNDCWCRFVRVDGVPIEIEEDKPFTDPRSIACPEAACVGTLRSGGRNVPNTLTFLICDVCACAYVAEDRPGIST